MKDKYFAIIKHCFRELNKNYQSELERLKNVHAFNYEKEIEDFYGKVAPHFIPLISLIENEEIKFEFFDEVEANIQTDEYLNRVDLIFERQFVLISEFEESMHLYFNDSDSAQLINEIKERFIYNKIPENLPSLFLRKEDEVDEINKFLDEYEVPEHLRLEMIYDQDMEIFKMFGSTPNDKDFANINKAKFTLAAKLYYIDVFSKLERIIKEALPNYQKKLESIHFLNNDKSNYIQLKNRYNNVSFKRNLYGFLLKNNLIECSSEDFESIFYPGETLIDWKGTQKQLMLLFKGTYDLSVTSATVDVAKSLGNRFTCGYVKLKFRNLRVSYDHAIKDKPVGVIHEFLAKLIN